MPGVTNLRVRPPVPVLSFLVPLVLLPVLAAAPASAEPESGFGAYEERVTPAAHYAALLSEEPEGAAVVVDDALSGGYDTDRLEEDLHRSFGGLGVPYHVVVSPFPGTGAEWGGEMLPSLHDRLGEEGLYVHIRPEDSWIEAEAHGVDLPVDDASGAVAKDPEIDYGTPVDELAEHYTAALLDPDVAERAAREWEHESESGPTVWEEFLGDLDPTSSVGPGNTGLAAGTGAGLVLALGCYVTWRLARRSRPGRPRIRVSVVSLTVVLPLTAAVALLPLSYTLSAPPGGAEIPDPVEEARSEPPYVSSTVRAEHLARELERAPVPLYVDPVSPMPLDGLADAAARLADSPVPVRAVVTPMDATDEFGGNPEVLAHALASVSGEDAVYVVVSGRAYEGSVEVTAAPVGVGIDTFTLGASVSEVEEPTPARAIGAVLDLVADMETSPEADDAPSFAGDHVYVPGPRWERYLSGGFLPGLLVVGPLIGLFLAGSVLGALALVRARRRTRRRSPSSRSLRVLAGRERARLGSLLSSDRAERVPRALMPQIEAALMVMERNPDDLDLLGVVAVSHRVHAVLEDPGLPVDSSPCAVNPLHGTATGIHGSRVTGGAVAPLCRGCADLPRSEQEANVLRIRDRGGARRSYLSMDDRTWVRHRFGARSPGRMVKSLVEEIDVR
ncbi:hypothetical protein HNR06_000161 [Nocardiopsis arvandica]|uniref:DUF4350 domain-containing protein n=1 Tax=Nocardiopsis sinuspersici TaxID=501010 RepID=A0A7Y9X7D8_9ACTN|nr:hypothetical protein [Nocardiopsis sinuspersici]NYH50572.1 hypothetical protein [Nocardiopsis sinuspersici]